MSIFGLDTSRSLADRMSNRWAFGRYLGVRADILFQILPSNGTSIFNDFGKPSLSSYDSPQSPMTSVGGVVSNVALLNGRNGAYWKQRGFGDEFTARFEFDARFEWEVNTLLCIDFFSIDASRLGLWSILPFISITKFNNLVDLEFPLNFHIWSEAISQLNKNMFCKIREFMAFYDFKKPLSFVLAHDWLERGNAALETSAFIHHNFDISIGVMASLLNVRMMCDK